MKEIDYNKLRLDVLERLIYERGIECNSNKTDMIRQLKLYDEDKYLVETSCEKYEKDKFIIGIDARNWKILTEMGKLIENGVAKRLNIYSDNRLLFISEKKLS